MNAPFTRRTVRAIAGTAVGATLLVGALAPPVAATDRRPQPKPPALTLTGTGTWQVRPWGDALVNGKGELQLRNPRPSRDVLVASNIGADDKILPGPGECEHATGTVTVYGARRVEFTMIGDGEICGVHTQPPTSIVTHVFTGTFEVYDETVRPRRLLGTDGFFEIRLADNGTASVFAIDT